MSRCLVAKLALAAGFTVVMGEAADSMPLGVLNPRRRELAAANPARYGHVRAVDPFRAEASVG